MKKFHFNIFLILILFLLSSKVIAQNASINLGPDKIGVNQMFTITLKIQDERLKSYDQFPEIKGFKKLGTSSSQSTNITNGQISFSQSLTQNYQALKEGSITIPPFRMTVNGKKVASNGKKVLVGPPIQRQRRRSWDPFADLFNDGSNQKTQEFVDVKADAFIAVTTNKKEVYLGEGFNLALSFYVLPKDDKYVDLVTTFLNRW